MNRIIFKSNNQTLEVGKGREFRLLEIDGIESGNYSIKSIPNLLNDGSKVTNKSIDSRSIPLVIEYTGTDKKLGREKAIRFFNIKHTGIMSIGDKSIEYEVEGFKSKLISNSNPFSCLVQLFCPKPYWYGLTNSKEVVQWEGGMTFPLILPTTFATEGEKVFNLINLGDGETPIIIEISGPATKPKILNSSTGEFIKLKKKVELGEILIITTELGNKRVEIDGVNAFSYIDLGSDFFQLQEGDNIIKLETEEINENSKIKIEYRNRYLGV